MSEQFNHETPRLPPQGNDFKVVPAKNGILWISQAYDLFKSSPVNWLSAIIVMTFSLLCSLVITMMLPFLFPAPFLLSSIFIGGLMIGCQQSSNGSNFVVKFLFSGFEKHLKNLSIIGFIYFIGIIVSCLIGLSISELLGYEVYQASIENITNNETEKQRFLESLVIPTLFMLGIMLPLIMAYWFAPPLITFTKASPIQAFKISLKACISNLSAFLIFGLVVIIGSFIILSIATIFAQLIPLIGLAIKFIIEMILYCIIIISVFCSYKDIFSSHEVEDDNNSSSDNNHLIA